MQEKQIIELFKGSIEKKIRSQIEVEDINIALIRKFPNISIELNNVYVESVGDAESSHFFNGINDTLLHFKRVFLEINALDIIRKDYHVSKLHFSKGKINIYSDKQGNTNAVFWENTKQNQRSNFAFDLNEIIISDADVMYKDAANTITSSSLVQKLKLSGSFDKEISSFQMQGNIFNKALYTAKFIWAQNIAVAVKTDAEFTKNRFSILNGTAKVNQQLIAFSGVLQRDTKLFNFSLSAEKLRIAKAKQLLPKNFNEHIDNISIGTISFKSTIQKKDKLKVPRINVQTTLKDLGYINQNKKIAFYVVAGEITYSNGINSNASSTYISLSDLILSPSKNSESKLAINGEIQNLDKKNLSLQTKCNIRLEELNTYLNSNKLTFLQGEAYGNIALMGSLDSDSISIEKVVSLLEPTELFIRGAKIENRGTEYHIHSNLHFHSTLEIDSTVIRYNNQTIKVKGEVPNLLEIVSNKNAVIKGYAKLEADSLDLNNIPLFAGEGSSHDSRVVQLKMIASCQALSFNSLLANNVHAQFTSGNKQIRFTNLKADIFDGRIAGNAIWNTQNKQAKLFMCDAEISDVNLQKIFSDLNNFSQDFITDKNIKGIAGGNVEIQFQLDTDYHLIPASLVLNADMNFSHGELINFEPLFSLSKYISISELEHVKFENLQNRFYIANEKLVFPQMAINSNAFHINASGTHYFDNNFKYHLIVHLSDVLSSKFKRKNAHTFEDIGTILEEDKGRIAVPLVIKGNTENYTVEYDKRKARENVRNEIQEEKNTILQIINNEFSGKQQTDTIAAETFIYFEEGDSSQTKKNEKVPVDDSESEVIIEWDDD
jgi:hypothetical protein